ncbi:hypothetical protein CPB83DRAFT_861642 [Crepidotus variabilis]|uniref:Uncharacterized protein n=1 Tax=Crepidotus variabilis TaxID=179855 RepID=A0A9P6E896_9AGAR|nr:hypothetical protein CPB83DRAFT_861642 [Crepidotus variabilis]
MTSRSRKRKYRPQGQGYSNYAHLGLVGDENELEFLGHHKRYAPAGTSSTLDTFNAEDSSNSFSESTDFLSLQGLYIQVYEADLVRGPSSESASAALEVVQYVPEDTGKGWKTTPTIGSALIKLGEDGFSIPIELGTVLNEEITPPSSSTPKEEITKLDIWVDRYDARLLLDAGAVAVSSSNSHLPPLTSIKPPDSPTGWSDLPSDAEDTFFLDNEEIEDVRREQRRLENERAREARLRARVEEDDEYVIRFGGKADVWGGSDEEPDEACKALLHRTATHLVSSPNPAQLEMRILANHGNDKRFAFLRGRWSRAWNLAKAKARMEMEKEKPNKKAVIGLLTGYGSGSESEDDEAKAKTLSLPQREDVSLPNQTIRSGKSKSPQVDEEALKEARRKRLKEWREKRQPN